MERSCRLLVYSALCNTLAYSQLPNYVPSSGLLAAYFFNGNANDVSGNGHNGILYGNTSLTSDRFGNPNSAYEFTTLGDYIQANTFSGVNPNFLSVSCWIKVYNMSPAPPSFFFFIS